MFEDFGNELNYFIEISKYNLPYILYIIAGLWFINAINWIFLGSKLNILGILPRHPFGLVGIICSPFLHGDSNHLFFNSIPLFALGLFVMVDGLNPFIEISLIIAFIAGALTWCFGRKAIHIGASGVISGYFSFVLIQAWERPSLTSVLLCGLALYYFGGIILSILPSEEKVSWEGHLFGFIAGIAALYVQRTLPPFIL